MSEPNKPPDRRGTELPLWFRMTLLTALTAGLLYQLFIKGDIAVSLMLGGIIGTALGVQDYFRNKSS